MICWEDLDTKLGATSTSTWSGILVWTHMTDHYSKTTYVIGLSDERPTRQPIHQNSQREMVSHALKILFHGTKSFMMAFRKSLAEELKAPVSGEPQLKERRPKIGAGVMSLDEAKLILNVDELDEAEGSFRKLFRANERKNGGSFYLQSKVVRARERISLEIRNRNEDIVSNAIERDKVL